MKRVSIGRLVRRLGSALREQLARGRGIAPAASLDAGSLDVGSVAPAGDAQALATGLARQIARRVRKD